jgi:hypothetical protein
MKNLKLISTFILAFICIGLFSCQSVKESKKVIDDFYSYTKAKDYNSIIGLLDPEALKSSPREQWINVLRGKEQMGNLIDYSQTYSGVNTSNGVTTTVLKFEVTYDKGTLYELFRLVENNGTYKILYYEYNENENSLSK